MVSPLLHVSQEIRPSRQRRLIGREVRGAHEHAARQRVVALLGPLRRADEMAGVRTSDDNGVYDLLSRRKQYLCARSRIFPYVTMR
jgi:hypothetical protein